MLDPQPAVFIPGKYDDNGKWMDGWETRRKRTTGYDFCIVKLARPGTIHGIDLDRVTSPATSRRQHRSMPARAKAPRRKTTPTGARSCRRPRCRATSTTICRFTDARAYTHLRVNIYPDGGIARLRVYGQPKVDWTRVERVSRVDLAASKRRLSGSGEQPAFRTGIADADARTRRGYGRRLGDAAPP